MGHKMKGIRVVRDYDPGVPLIAANGGALNQAWTNLKDNAADALNGSEQITLRTAPSSPPRLPPWGPDWDWISATVSW
ncbi:MAG TPA: hypothetical protein VFD42_08555 [Chloroflexota bacterium]|nr:hypothetical protein [Chloroflexota bacterium]